MRAEQILQQLAAGKCVRRAGWPEFRYLTTTRRGRLTVHGEHDQKEQISLPDLQASDWEIYDGPTARYNARPARAGEAT